jgi:predicted membrane metal-binding protein
MTLSFGATLAISVAWPKLFPHHEIHGLPALPLLAFGFLAPNADLLWRKLRSADAWGSLRSERSETG